ncbi:MAG: ATP-binding cassette domain-containing protein [Burkholderiaceae bacterium]|nr:ATP-binding cassette domain-containing protein [Burkholderiaceae bacterium]
MPVWQVEVRKQLRLGASRFELDLRFSSEARRVVLYGPSGAGKTQTLRMIAGITPPDSGVIRVAGRTLLDTAGRVSLSPQDRQVGYVFQDYALFPHLTVRQNIAFALRGGWRNPARHGPEPRVDRWIEQFRLQDVAGHFPHQISGGQRQRTALARALVGEPVALLLDEPFAALDRSLRQRLRQELLELQQSLDLPLLLITHDDEDVECLAQSVVRIDGGRLAGARQDVARPPARAGRTAAT